MSSCYNPLRLPKTVGAERHKLKTPTEECWFKSYYDIKTSFCFGRKRFFYG